MIGNEENYPDERETREKKGTQYRRSNFKRYQAQERSRRDSTIPYSI